MLPTSGKILEWAEKQTVPLTIKNISEKGDGQFLSKLGRELFIIVRTKTVVGSKARAQLKLLDQWQGLEAWRRIRVNLAKRDVLRLQREFGAMCQMAPMKMSNFSNFATAITSWHGQLDRYEGMGHGFQLLVQQRQNILLAALPNEVKKEYELQAALRPFESYEKVVDFLTNLSTSSSFRSDNGPDFKPFTMNMVETGDASAGPPVEVNELNQYTDVELETWVATQDFVDRTSAGGQPCP